MSAERRTRPKPEEEVNDLRKKNQALRKRVKELEAERDKYIHAANALYAQTITVDQIKEWDREDEPGGDLMELMRRLDKEGKRK